MNATVPIISNTENLSRERLAFDSDKENTGCVNKSIAQEINTILKGTENINSLFQINGKK